MTPVRLEPWLPEVARRDLHAALLGMQAAGGAGLMRQDNPHLMTAEDHAAALSVAGEPRHLLWLD